MTKSTKKSDSRSGTVPADAPASFAARVPSPAWERVDFAPYFFWAWYKPAHVPAGLVVRVPDDAYQKYPLAAQWTLRRLVQAAGVEPAAVTTWQLYGANYPGMNGTNPYLDAPIPVPPPGADPNIVVCLQTAPAAQPFAPPRTAAPLVPYVSAPMPPVVAAPFGAATPATMPMAAAAQSVPASARPMPAPSGVPADVNLTEMFEFMQADWHASVETEKELVRLRKQFIDLVGRLKNLNRDLTSDERRYADNQDKKDWLDARRGLREGSLRLWRCIKELDMGDMSFAGRKQWLEQIYEQFVVPRLPFEGIQQARREFEQQRKLVSTLHSNMNTAYSIATAEGERRAQQILTRIQTKMREATNKKNFLGVIID